MSHPVWKFLTSLRLTVVCLAFCLVLVFAGTLAQVHEGLYNAQARWFRSVFVWWGPANSHWQLPVFPGGYLVGSLLLANLVAAHIKRFTWSPRKVGIQLTHIGVIVLLLGGLLTDLFSNESLLGFHEGETKEYTESQRDTELVFAFDTDGKQQRVIAFAQKALRAGQTLTAAELPFTVTVKDWQPNSQVVSRAGLADAVTKLTSAIATVEGQFSTPDALPALAAKAMETEGRTEVWRKGLQAVGEKDPRDLVEAARRVQADPPRAARLCIELKTRFRTEMLERFRQSGGALQYAAERFGSAEAVNPDKLPPASSEGDGKSAIAFPLPESTKMDGRNLPYAVIELQQEGKSLGTWLMSPWLDAQEIGAGGRHFHAALRFERTYLPFTATLVKITNEFYQGTDIPKNYQSRVRINNPTTGETREVDIYMNNPLRYAGLTFFQYQMSQAEAAAGRPGSSTLQVVKNPAWTFPYWGCVLVAVGMIYQFLYHLIGFIGKRRQPAVALPLPGPGKSSRQSAAASTHR